MYKYEHLRLIFEKVKSFIDMSIEARRSGLKKKTGEQNISCHYFFEEKSLAN
jgi:hypothetical protein